MKKRELIISFSDRTGLLAIQIDGEGVELANEDIQAIQQIIDGDIDDYSNNVFMELIDEGISITNCEAQLEITFEEGRKIIAEAKKYNLASADDFK